MLIALCLNKVECYTTVLYLQCILQYSLDLCRLDLRCFDYRRQKFCFLQPRFASSFDIRRLCCLQTKSRKLPFLKIKIQYLCVTICIKYG